MLLENSISHSTNVFNIYDIQIGNLMLHDGELCTVISNDENGFIVTTKSSGIKACNKLTHEILPVEPNHYFLTVAGLSHKKQNEYHSNYGKVLVTNKKNRWLFSWISVQEGCVKSFNSIHELQNLYQLFCKKQLDFDLQILETP